MSSTLYETPTIVDRQIAQPATLNVAYIAADAEGQVTSASHAAAMLLGYSGHIAHGHTLTDACMPLVGADEQIAAVRAGVLPQFIIERINIENEQGCRYISLTVLAQPPGVLVVISDVTLQSAQQQQLQQQHYELMLLHDTISAKNRQLAATNDELLRVSQQKSDMLAVATHDLRSPLTTLYGYASLLRANAFGVLTEVQYKPVDAILRQTERMLDLVSNLLDLRRLEEQATFELRSCDLAKTTAQAVRAFHDQAAFAGITLTYAALQTPCTAMIDSSAIEQALANLISNGIKYSERSGSVTVQLRLLETLPPLTPPLDHAQAWCAIEVADNGAGIAQADLERVFEPFFRTSAAQQSSSAGSGLGLSIVQRVVQRHDGRITVESTLGVGSRFTLYLPYMLG